MGVMVMGGLFDAVVVEQYILSEAVLTLADTKGMQILLRFGV